MIKTYMRKAVMIEETMKVIEDGQRFKKTAEELKARCIKLNDPYKKALSSKYLIESDGVIGYNFSYWACTIEAHTKKEIMTAYQCILDNAVRLSKLVKELRGILIIDLYEQMEKGHDVEVDDVEYVEVKQYAWAWDQRDIRLVGTTGKGTKVIVLEAKPEETSQILRDLELTGVAAGPAMKIVFVNLRLDGNYSIRLHNGLITWMDKTFYNKYDEAKNTLKKAVCDTIGWEHKVTLGNYTIEYNGALSITYIGKNTKLEGLPLMVEEMEAMARELLTEYDEISPNFEHINHYTKGYILACGETVDSFFPGVYWAKSGTPEADHLQEILDNAGI